MKSFPSSLTAAVFSVDDAGRFAARDLLPSGGLVIVIQDRACAAMMSLPIESDYTPIYRWQAKPSLPTHRKPDRAYARGPNFISRLLIDVLA